MAPYCGKREIWEEKKKFLRREVLEGLKGSTRSKAASSWFR